MFGAKPLASLSPGLLARKGQARPAMRPQAVTGLGGAPAHDDLGWNDMGAPAPEATLPPVLVEREALKGELEQPLPESAPVDPAPAPLRDGQVSPEPEPEPEPEPVAGPGPAPVAPVAPVAPEVIARIGREAARAGKAAFTLRLPPDRHLRLRLASAVRHRSAQAIVTDALDAFLATLPDVERLAEQCAAPDRPKDRP